MQTKAWLAWLAVFAAVAIAVLLKIVVQPDNWALGVALVPGLLAIGYILGGTDEDEPEAPGKRGD
jgi:hypothetical protein